MTGSESGTAWDSELAIPAPRSGPGRQVLSPQLRGDFTQSNDHVIHTWVAESTLARS